MKSFKQYISENWSHATPEDMSDKNAHKYLFHTTSESNAKKIVRTGSLEPRPAATVASTAKTMQMLSQKYIKDLGIDGDDDFNPFQSSAEHFADKLDHTYTLRSGGDLEAMHSALRGYGRMGGKGRAVIKFPIANLSRNVARKMKIDHDGSDVGTPSDNPYDNLIAIKTKGPIENKFIP